MLQHNYSWTKFDKILALEMLWVIQLNDEYTLVAINPHEISKSV